MTIMTTATATQTSVLYVRQHDAKNIKTWLEKHSFLNKQYRMTPVSRFVTVDKRYEKKEDSHDNDDTNNSSHRDSSLVMDNVTWCHCDISPTARKCIAIPVTHECMEIITTLFHQQNNSRNEVPATCYDNDVDLEKEKHFNDKDKRGIVLFPQDDYDNIYNMILGFGRCKCPYSSSVLGNHRQARIINNYSYCSCTKDHTSLLLSLTTNNIQRILAETLTNWLRENNECTNISHECNMLHQSECFASLTTQSIQGLSISTCPTKLEILGDDTLVIPRWAFFIPLDKNIFMDSHNSNMNTLLVPSIQVKMTRINEERNEFRELLLQLIHGNKDNLHCNSSGIMHSIQSQLWANLATHFHCSRVVRRGDIDPESGVRESGHRIVWPIPKDDASSEVVDCNHGYVPTTTGIDSPGWITVIENKVIQSFDMTRVMFSRGNVTEKMRFGMSLVQPGEHVLDMYAGIGYYTLPALIHGKARHVTACEWNEHALYALRHNLRANGIPEDKVTVLEGDCRITLKQHLLQPPQSSQSDKFEEEAELKRFDRISLGLLPSSEGGWATAVSSLRKATGGWLHVHGNVATIERENWSHWLCRTLARNCHNDWLVVCTHIEKVKSFAPKIDHVVADVFVGPSTSPKVPESWNNSMTTGVIDSSGTFVRTSSVDVFTPSCALDEDGILHQSWMRE